jgi:hypothetical protein
MPQQQWQKINEFRTPRPSSSRKRVQFIENYNPQKSEHFTKPSYIPSEVSRSKSLPQLPPVKNEIPTRLPSGGFKASFLPSDLPSSTREKQEMPRAPEFPHEYSDNSKLGASAAKITELMKHRDDYDPNKWNALNTDGEKHLKIIKF